MGVAICGLWLSKGCARSYMLSQLCGYPSRGDGGVNWGVCCRRFAAGLLGRFIVCGLRSQL